MVSIYTRTKLFLRKLKLFDFLKKCRRYLSGRKTHPIQNFKSVDCLDLIRLGSLYGGWTLIDNESLVGATIISAGLGEDASFDVEFAAKYGAQVIVIDPTPRAVEHFKNIERAIGEKAQTEYSEGGCQPVTAYDLSALSHSSLRLVRKALWDKTCALKFYCPSNPSYVSHSISNFQNNYSAETPFIEVQAQALDEILNDLDIDSSNIALIKLDIEGAEIEVLTQCMNVGIKPHQILVEFDELNSGSDRGFDRVTEVHGLLLNNGYGLAHNDGQANFLFVRHL